MKSILITNANTFKGYHLCHEAIKRDYRVYAIIDNKAKHKVHLNHNKIIIIGDSLADSDLLAERLLQLKSKLISFNTILHVTIDRYSGYKNNLNISQTKNLLEALEKSKTIPHRLILSSNILAQGPLSKLNYQIGKTDTAPVTEYGEELLEAENLVRQQEYFSYIILRTAFTYGVNDNKIMEFIKLTNNNISLYALTSDLKLSTIYIKDMLDIYFYIIESSISNKTYAVSDGRQYTIEQIYLILKKILNKKPISITLPLFAIKFISKLSKFVPSLLYKDTILELKQKYWYCGINELRDDTGWKPQYNLEKGLIDTINLYKIKKWL